MAESVTFIHAADLHLGAPFRGLRDLSPTWSDRMVAAIPEAFDRMVSAAVERRVDFVVMAGDIFDASHPSYADFRRFFDGMAVLDKAGIPVYLCTGNHDPYTSWKSDFGELPASAFLFPADKPGYFAYQRDGRPLVLLGGRGYYNQSVSPDEDIAAGITRTNAERSLGCSAPFGVGVLHTGLNLDPTKAPTDPSNLLKSGMDYWALGHIHQPWQDSSRNPRLAFSGCIQGRDIKETGPRGCYQVTLRQGEDNRAEFIPCAGVVWQRLDVDVSACTTLVEVHDAIMRQLFAANGSAQCEEMVERITLTGRSGLHQVLRQPGVVDDLRSNINDSYPAFFCDALIDRTRPVFDREALARDGLFPAAVLRQSQAMASQPDAMRAFLQEEFLEKNISMPASCDSDVEGLRQQAEDLVLDLLEGDRS